MRKNVSGQYVSTQLRDTSGNPVTTGTTTVYVTGDNGTQSTGSGTVTHKGNGCWTYAPTQAETNYTHVVYTFINTGAIPKTEEYYPVSYDPTDAAALGLTNFDATISSRAAAATALSNVTWTDTKAGYLDTAISGCSSHSAADVADAVWDELRANHTGTGSFGEYLLSKLADSVTHGGSTALLSLKSIGVLNTEGAAVSFNTTGGAFPALNIDSQFGNGVSIRAQNFAHGVQIWSGSSNPTDPNYAALLLIGGAGIAFSHGAGGSALVNLDLDTVSANSLASAVWNEGTIGLIGLDNMYQYSGDDWPTGLIVTVVGYQGQTEYALGSYNGTTFTPGADDDATVSSVKLTLSGNTTLTGDIVIDLIDKSGKSVLFTIEKALTDLSKLVYTILEDSSAALWGTPFTRLYPFTSTAMTGDQVAAAVWGSIWAQSAIGNHLMRAGKVYDVDIISGGFTGTMLLQGSAYAFGEALEQAKGSLTAAGAFTPGADWDHTSMKLAIDVTSVTDINVEVVLAVVMDSTSTSKAYIKIKLADLKLANEYGKKLYIMADGTVSPFQSGMVYPTWLSDVNVSTIQASAPDTFVQQHVGTALGTYGTAKTTDITGQCTVALTTYDAPTFDEFTAGLAALNDLSSAEAQAAVAAAITAASLPSTTDLTNALDAGVNVSEIGGGDPTSYIAAAVWNAMLDTYKSTNTFGAHAGGRALLPTNITHNPDGTVDVITFNNGTTVYDWKHNYTNGKLVSIVLEQGD